MDGIGIGVVFLGMWFALMFALPILIVFAVILIIFRKKLIINKRYKKVIISALIGLVCSTLLGSLLFFALSLDNSPVEEWIINAPIIILLIVELLSLCVVLLVFLAIIVESLAGYLRRRKVN